MIKLQKHLSSSFNYKTECIIYNNAKKIWNYLNTESKNKKRKPISIVCLDFYINALKPKYRKEVGIDYTTAQRHRKFFHFLTKNNFRKLKSIVFAHPKELEKIRNEIFLILKKEDIYSMVYNETTEKYEPKQTKFGELLLKKIFIYNNFRKTKICLDVLVKLKFKNIYCPYCNENKLKIVTRHNDVKKFESQLDHFYSKSENPFFAVSLYNLIPSCSICNAHYKGKFTFNLDTHIHPYYECFNELLKFNVSNHISLLLNGTIDDFELLDKKIGSKKNKKKTLEELNILERKKEDIEEVEEVTKLYHDYHGYTNQKEEELFKRALMLKVPIEEKDILRKSNGKLYRDVIQQMDTPNKLNIK